MSEVSQLDKFLANLIVIEKNREFDRKVDRLKKSSSAVTVWAVLPGLFGIFGIAHFYLNRPIEGLVILLSGFTFTALTFLFYAVSLFAPYYTYNLPYLLNPTNPILAILVGVNISFFVANIIAARYHYTRYDFYIHLKATKPWNNWGLKSMM